jgi:hypothetical protein
MPPTPEDKALNHLYHLSEMQPEGHNDGEFAERFLAKAIACAALVIAERLEALQGAIERKPA